MIYYTVSQVARIIQLTPYTVRQLLRNGTLKGTKPTGAAWRVHEDDLKEFLEAKHGKQDR